MAENYNQATSTANESVLFVDDEPYILTALRRLMRPLKLEMYFAESGDEGLKILKDLKLI